MRILPLLVATLLSVPAVAAEFGAVSESGFPINVDGEEVRPYIPAHWLEDPRVQAAWDSVVAQAAVEPVNKINGLTIYPYYPILTAEMQRLATDHPDLVRLHSAGTSRLGLDLWMLEIADFDNPERLPLAEREVVYLDGGTHSNEYSGVYFITEWAQFLLDEYETNETAQWIVQNRHTWLLPMANPDGSHVMGRLNAALVNINRNFPATWGTTEELPPLNYKGPYPNSEPETRIVGDLFSTLVPDYAGSIHCCGNLWLYPYGAEHLGDPHDEAMLSKTCDIVFPDVRSACGPIWSTIYPAGGSTVDEAYERVGSAAWGFEMSGRGAIAPWGQPVITADVREQEIESWRAVMHAFLNVERYGAQPMIHAVNGDANTITVTVRNDGLGNLTIGTLSVAGHAVSLPFLATGEVVDVEVPGRFAPGAVPLEVEWQKRLHPESPSGHKMLEIDLMGSGGSLAATVPIPAEKPSMTYLLASPLPDDSPAKPVPSDYHNEDDKDSPALGLLLVVALVGIAGLAARRR